MPTRHNLTRADYLYAGDGYHPGYFAQNERVGFRLSHVYVHRYGAIATLQAEGLMKDATSTELPNNATTTYTPATDGSSPLDGSTRPTVTTVQVAGQTVTVYDLATPRNVTVSVTHGSSVVAMTMLVSGYDEYLQPMSELLTITATGTTKTAAGLKAFRYVSSIALTSASDSTANTVDMGYGDVIGLPVRCDQKSDFIIFQDGAIDTATKVVAVTTDPATTTTGDVRGTWDGTNASDGTRIWTAWIFVYDHSTQQSLFGITQA